MQIKTTMEYYSPVKKKEEENFTLHNSMDGPGEHYAEWNKPVRERHMPWFHSYVESNEQTELAGKTERDS